MARSGTDSLRPRDTKPPDFVQRGKVLILRKQFQDAVKVCRLGLLAHPTFVEGRLVLGMALMALTRYDEVLAEMRVALELDPQNPMAHLLKGEALFFKREVEQARNALRQARELDPHNIKARKLLDELDELGRGPNMPIMERTKSETKVYPAQRAQQAMLPRDPSAVLEMVESWAGGRLGQRGLSDQQPQQSVADLSGSSPIQSAAEQQDVPSSLQVRAASGHYAAELDEEDEDFATAPFLPPNVNVSHQSARLHEDWDEDTCADDKPPSMDLDGQLLDDDETEQGGGLASGSYRVPKRDDTVQPLCWSATGGPLPEFDDQEEEPLPAQCDSTAVGDQGVFSDPEDSGEQTADLRDASSMERALYPADDEGTTETDANNLLGSPEAELTERILSGEGYEEEDKGEQTQVDKDAPTPEQLFGEASLRRGHEPAKALELEADQAERQNISLPRISQVRYISGVEVEPVRSTRQRQLLDGDVSIELSMGDLQELAGEESGELFEAEMPPLPGGALQAAQSGSYGSEDSDDAPTRCRQLEPYGAGPPGLLASEMAPEGEEAEEPVLATRVHFPAPANWPANAGEPFVAGKALPAAATHEPDMGRGAEQNPFAVPSDLHSQSYERSADHLLDSGGLLPPEHLDDSGRLLPPEHLDDSGGVLQPEHLDDSGRLLPPEHLDDSGGLLPPEHLADDVGIRQQGRSNAFGSDLPPEHLDPLSGDLPSPRFDLPAPGLAEGRPDFRHATEYLDPEDKVSPPEYLDALDRGLDPRTPESLRGGGGGGFAVEQGFFPRRTLDMEGEEEQGLPPRDRPRSSQEAGSQLPPSLRVQYEQDEPSPVLHHPRDRSPAAADDDSRIFLQEAAARVRKSRWRRAGPAKPRASLATLLLGEPGSIRWAFWLVGAVSALVAAVGIGLAVRYFRLGEQIEIKRTQAVQRLQQGNLPDFTAAAQSYTDILAQRPDDREALWAHRRIQAAIPFEFGDPIPQQQPPGQQAPDLVDFQVAKIYQQLLDGSLDDAAVSLDQAQEKHPDSPLLEYLAGYVELLRGNSSAAEGHLRRASELSPTDTLIRAALGESLFARGQGRTGEALAAFEQALALNPDHISSVLGKARVLLAARQQLAEVERELNSVILEQRRRLASRGQRGWAFLLLAQVSYLKGQLDMAKQTISQAKSNMPIKDPIFLDELAGTLISVFQLGEAEKVVQQSKALMRGRPHPYYRMAQILIQHGQPEAALKELDQTRGVHFPASDVLRAQINLMLGKLEEAEKQVEQALRLTSGLLEAHIVKAKLLAARGKTDEAQQNIQGLLKNDADNPKLLTALGEIYLAAGKTQQARDKLHEALRMDKHSFDAQLKLAQVFMQEGNYQEAVSRLQAASRANYSNVIALKELARLEAEMGDLAEAATNYQEVLKRAPADSKTRLALAWVLIEQRKYSEAAVEIALAEKERAADGELALVKGLLAFRSGESRDAVALFEAAASKQPDNLKAQGLLVQAYFLHREEAKARATAQKLERRAAGAPEGELARGRIFLNSGQPQVALNHLKRAERALQHHRRPPVERADLLVSLGMAYQESGQLRQAEETFNEAISACPLCPEPYYRRGLVQDERGAIGEALESLERSIQLEPRFVEAHFDMGQILERDGQKQRAINAYEKYIKLDPVREMREAAEQAIRNLKRGS